jgi:hypothetical protein
VWRRALTSVYRKMSAFTCDLTSAATAANSNIYDFNVEGTNCPIYSSFFGVMGATSAMIFSGESGVAGPLWHGPLGLTRLCWRTVFFALFFSFLWRCAAAGVQPRGGAARSAGSCSLGLADWLSSPLVCSYVWSGF